MTSSPYFRRAHCCFGGLPDISCLVSAARTNYDSHYIEDVNGSGKNRSVLSSQFYKSLGSSEIGYKADYFFLPVYCPTRNQGTGTRADMGMTYNSSCGRAL